MSAYFARRNEDRLYGRVTSGNGAITTADLTFPMQSEGAITVFLDRLRMSEGDLELVLQALVSESRAFILSRPKTMVMVEQPTPAVIKTVQNYPYSAPVVVGNTVVQPTAFRDTGVTLQVTVPELVDDDNDWSTTDDTYIKLDVMVDVLELGTDLIIALDDRLSGAEQISAPTFTSRKVKTTVWVRHGQVLILGGLYRNRKTKNLSTLPWVSQAENVAVGMAERVVPGNVLAAPISATVGNRSSATERRELVFFIKTETWRPAYTVADEHGFEEFVEEKKGRIKPTDVISDVVEGIVEIPKGIAEGISGESLGSDLGTELEGGQR
ncbi:MAG: hypothetical protein JXR94_20955 [Candidatus Hydrogenedentes bacterium]|nr:hypothetical protein [Candidatus Hydrogenedentota bacterium]